MAPKSNVLWYYILCFQSLSTLQCKQCLDSWKCPFFKLASAKKASANKEASNARDYTFSSRLICRVSQAKYQIAEVSARKTWAFSAILTKLTYYKVIIFKYLTFCWKFRLFCWYAHGGCRLQDLSISQVIDHVTCYNSSALIGGQFIFSKKILYKICSPVWML